MARMTTHGLSELMVDLDALADASGEITDNILLAGAFEIKKEWIAAIRKQGLVDTGEMVASVGYGKRPRPDGEFKKIVVYPMGVDSKGVRNAQKAFVHNYGHPGRGIKMTRFIDDAERRVQPKLERRVDEVYDAELKKRGF